MLYFWDDSNTMHVKLICGLLFFFLLEFFPIVTGLIMAEDWDVEAMLEAPYKKEVRLLFFCIHVIYILYILFLCNLSRNFKTS